MNMKRYKHYLVLIGLLSLTSIVLIFAVDVNVPAEPGVRAELPAVIGDWRGQDLFFCQDESCMRGFASDELVDTNTCKVCGGHLRQTWSLGETRVLPADTLLLKKLYTNPEGIKLTVSAVITGKEQGSIHRPQMCLTGQGYEIVSEKKMAVPITEKKNLGMEVLSIVKRYHRPDGTVVEQPGVFAYWFAGKGRDTSSHVLRVFYTMVDRIVFNRASRWAYIAVADLTGSGSDAHVQQIREFVRLLYPLMAKP
jgi:hypothetical protein